MTRRILSCPYCHAELTIAPSTERCRISIACGDCLGLCMVDPDTLQVTFKAERTYYEILGVPPTADDELIKKNYHLLIHRFHPDHGNGNSVITQAVIEAYGVLRDRHKRHLYDIKLRTSQGVNPAAAAASRRYAKHRNEERQPLRVVFRKWIIAGTMVGLLLLAAEIAVIVIAGRKAAQPAGKPSGQLAALENYLPPVLTRDIEKIRAQVIKFYSLDEKALKKIEDDLGGGHKEEQHRW